MVEIDRKRNRKTEIDGGRQKEREQHTKRGRETGRKNCGIEMERERERERKRSLPLW